MAANEPGAPPQTLDVFVQALLANDRVAVRRIFSTSVEQAGALPVIERLVVATLDQIGELWDQGELSLAQVYMSGRICEDLVDTLLPPAKLQRISQPAIAIAVLDDYHMLGKRMVYSALRASGYEVHDYGRIDVATLVARAIADELEVLLISVLMLPSALQIRAVRQQLERAGRRPTIIVGGAPFRFDEQLWRDVGADAMGRTAIDGVTLIGRLLRGAA